MANVNKNGGQTQGNPPQGNPPQGMQPQGVQPQGGQPQGMQPQGGQVQRNQPQGQQRGELIRRDPFQMLFRDPFQLMREMMTDPFRMFSQLPWGGGMGHDLSWNPGFDIRETEDAFVFKADLPGIRSEDLEIQLVGNQLQISGKRECEQEQGEGRYHTYERSYGSFSRVFSLPESADLDKITSDLKDGELRLVVPKKAGSSPQRRKIQVGAGTKS